MTTSQSGGPEYDERIRRAERLSAKHPFATEFLDFFRHVASFQKNLRTNINSSSPGVKPASDSAQKLRGPLDFTVVLPHFRGFLSLVEKQAPPALSESARQFSQLSSDSWIASLQAYWELAGTYDQQVGALV
jgi:formate dehydrogenase maturation protein FdhE